MYLHEYQSKQAFARHGIPVPAGKIATTEQEASAIASEFGVPVVVNAQALAHERVFRLARTPQEAELVARDIFAQSIQGVRIHTLLIEPAAEIVAEYFLGLYADRGSNLLMVASTEGGGEISQIERDKPQTLARETINPMLGILDFQARNLANGINLPRENWKAFIPLAYNFYRCCVDCDAVRGEINPLGLTRTGDLIALGGKLEIDDNALFRQRELAAIRDERAEHESIVLARNARISYVHLSGSIGLMVSGAGLGMATMDLLARHHAEASSFLDLGSNIQRDKVSVALGLILPNVRALLINIFADRAPCDEIAEELLAAIHEIKPTIPLIVRLAGEHAAEGRAILSAVSGVDLSFAATTTEAVQRAAEKGEAHVNSGQ